MKLKVPAEIEEIAEKLQKQGYSAYLVGGCIRDLLLKNEPKDWDITTDARPEEIQKLFPESVYENDFGTVGVKTGSETPSLRIVEITTFRLEGRYTDKRHPDEIKFAKTVEEDLSRRDFTVNALAFDLNKEIIIDPFSGKEDLENKIIRAVGDPVTRFNEDALRLLRAVRFSAQLGFKVEDNTAEALKRGAHLLEIVSNERIRDEFMKLIMTPRAAEGIEALVGTGLMRFIVPEILEGVGIAQNKHHIYTVYEHNLKALEYAVKKNYSLGVRLASFFHDVGKPRTKRGEGPDATFHGHEVVGAKMVLKIMDKLRFPKEVIEYVAHLVRWHMFYYNVGEVSEAGVRRFLRRIGTECLDDLLRVREADRIGSGVPKAVPYKLRHLMFMIDKVKRDPISPKALKIDGNEVMKILGVEPGPRIGHILALLLEEVIEKPELNDREILITRLQELNKMTDAELAGLRKKAEAVKDEFEAAAEKEIKRKHKVQ